MRVGLITSVPLNPPWDQGDKNFAYALTQALPEIIFHIFTARNEPEPVGSNLYKLALFRSRVPSLDQKFRVYWWFLEKSFSRLGKINIDIYHMSYQPFGFSSMLLKWLPVFRRIPSIHTVPATATIQNLSASHLFADQIVAMSDYGKRKLENMGLMNVLHIPVGVKSSDWKITPDMIEKSKTLLGVTGKKVILFPGHYRETYGIDTLLKAMPELSNVYPDIHYIFACRMRSPADWNHEKQVRSEVERLGLTQAVKYLHTVDDMKSVVSASDVIIMPFKSMLDKIDIPTTLLEAMAAGKPFVISDIPPMNEIVHLEGNQLGKENVGFVHTPGDAKALASSILQIFSDDSLRSVMSENGIKLVRERYDIMTVAKQYMKQYKEMAS